MKRRILAIFAFVLALVFVILVLGFASIYLRSAKISCGSSDMYSKAEIKSAIEVVKDKFGEFDGCKLLSLSYAGDEDSLKEFDYNPDYDEAIVINSRFISPLFGGGGWNSHELYTWHFILMRKDKGPWTLLTYGYC